jgi:hypothetical protein
MTVKSTARENTPKKVVTVKAKEKRLEELIDEFNKDIPREKLREIVSEIENEGKKTASEYLAKELERLGEENLSASEYDKELTKIRKKAKSLARKKVTDLEYFFPPIDEIFLQTLPKNVLVLRKVSHDRKRLLNTIGFFIRLYPEPNNFKRINGRIAYIERDIQNPIPQSVEPLSSEDFVKGWIQRKAPSGKEREVHDNEAQKWKEKMKSYGTYINCQDVEFQDLPEIMRKRLEWFFLVKVSGNRYRRVSPTKWFKAQYCSHGFLPKCPRCDEKLKVVGIPIRIFKNLNELADVTDDLYFNYANEEDEKNIDSNFRIEKWLKRSRNYRAIKPHNPYF